MELKYKRVLLKLSGEAMGGEHSAVSFEAVEQAARQIAMLHENGVEVGIVIGGGNIWRGRSSGDVEKNRADHIGMLATAINSLAMQDAIEKKGMECVVLSAVEMQRFCDTFSSRAANNALKEGKVVIFACGSGSPFFTTDTAAALRAAEINADVLLLAKNVDAVYSDDPKKNANAVKYDELRYSEVIEKGLRATDLTAITLCSEQNIPILVFAMKDEENILNAVKGQKVGTLIH